MKKFIRYKLVILFFLFIITLTAADMLGDVKAFSTLENRVLAQEPKITKESVISNEFTMKYEKYIDDQFIERDRWIDLKSRAEFLLGKIENNGIVYGQQNFMFEKYPNTNEERLNSNVDHIIGFIKGYNGKVTVGVIPTSYMKNQEKLPFGLNNLDQYSYIDDIDNKISATRNSEGVSASSFSLEESPLEYYRTDHHWTTVGAYKAYAELMEQWERPYIPLERGILGDDTTTGTLGLIDVGEFYGTYFNKTKAFNAVPDQLGYFDIPVTGVTVDGKKVNGLYDYGKLATRDKYGMFLHGNNGVTVIQSDNYGTLTKEKKAPIVMFNTTSGPVQVPAEDISSSAIEDSNAVNLDNEMDDESEENDNISRVLLIKDSYGNCFAPYLTYSFDEVVVVDLRSMNKPISEFIKEKKYDEVIILYSFMNMSQDINLAKISR